MTGLTVPTLLQKDASAVPRLSGTSSGDPASASRVWRVSACLLAVGLYAVAFVTSATTMNVKDQSNQESATARVIFHDLARTDRRSE